MTNFEKIKAMSVEEMAELLGGLTDRACVNCNDCLMKKECQYPFLGCDENALKWLESEAEE